MEDVNEQWHRVAELGERMEFAAAIADRIMRIQVGAGGESDPDDIVGLVAEQLTELDQFLTDEKERAALFSTLAMRAWKATVDDAIDCTNKPPERTYRARALALTAAFLPSETKSALRGLSHDDRMGLTYEYLGLIGHILTHAGLKPGDYAT